MRCGCRSVPAPPSAEPCPKYVGIRRGTWCPPGRWLTPPGRRVHATFPGRRPVRSVDGQVRMTARSATGGSDDRGTRPRQAVPIHARGGQSELRCPPRHGDRIPRPEWCRQVHDDAHDHGPGPAGRGTGQDRREALRRLALAASRGGRAAGRAARRSTRGRTRPCPPDRAGRQPTRSADGGTRKCSPSPASRKSRTAGPGSSRSACPSGWASPLPCSAIRRCCSARRAGQRPGPRRHPAGSATC